MAVEILDPEVKHFLDKKGSFPQLKLPTLESLPQELLGISERLHGISGTWNPVEIFTADATSIKAEKTSLLAAYQNGETYNPTFAYIYAAELADQMRQADAEHQLNELQLAVRRFTPDSSSRLQRLTRVALNSKIEDDIATVDLAGGISSGDEDRIAHAMRLKYGGTNPVLVERAFAIFDSLITGIKEPVEDVEVVTTPEEQEFLKKPIITDDETIKGAFEFALGKFGILRTDDNPIGFIVEISDEVTAIDVRYKSKNGPTIYINKGRATPEKPMTWEKLLELNEHEIRGHARQIMNGKLLFSLDPFDTETLYEGLAKRYDERFHARYFGKKAGSPSPYYTIAISSAERGSSFFEVFSEQVDLRLREKLKIARDLPLPNRDSIDPKIIMDTMNSSWTTTYRTMRGHTDTKNDKSYATGKDLSYLQGWIMDSQLRESGYAHVNETAVIAEGGLAMLAEFNIEPDDLPIKDLEIADIIMNEIVRPQMQTSSTTKDA